MGPATLPAYGSRLLSTGRGPSPGYVRGGPRIESRGTSGRHCDPSGRVSVEVKGLTRFEGTRMSRLPPGRREFVVTPVGPRVAGCCFSRPSPLHLRVGGVQCTSDLSRGDTDSGPWKPGLTPGRPDRGGSGTDGVYTRTSTGETPGTSVGAVTVGLYPGRVPLSVHVVVSTQEDTL